MDFQVVVFSVHVGLWKVVDSAHPQLSVEYADRQDAIDCARGLATENAPALVEVLTDSMRLALRERYIRTAEGLVRLDEPPIAVDDTSPGDGSLRSTG